MDIRKTKKTLLSKKSAAALLLGLGIFLIILSALSGGDKIGKEEQMRYCEYLENKLKTTLETVTGKDTIDVMITLEKSYEITKETETDAPVFSGGAEGESSISGSEQIGGVMIVCRGVYSSEDFATIKRAAATVLNTSENNIYIIGGNSHEEHS